MLVCRCSMLKKCSHLALQHPGLLRHFSHLFRGGDNSLVLASCHTSLWTWRARVLELTLTAICIPTAMHIHAFRRRRLLLIIERNRAWRLVFTHVQVVVSSALHAVVSVTITASTRHFLRPLEKAWNRTHTCGPPALQPTGIQHES